MSLKVQIIDEAGNEDISVLDFTDRVSGWALMERCAKLSEKYPRFNVTFYDASEVADKKINIIAILNKLKNK